MNQSHHSSPNIAVVIRFVDGTFEEGFNFEALILENGQPIAQYPPVDEAYDSATYERTPPAPELPELYRQWQSTYFDAERARGALRKASGGQWWTIGSHTNERKIDVPEDVKTHYSSSVNNTKVAKEALGRYLKENWFRNKESFRNLQFWVKGNAKLKDDQSLPIFFEFRASQADQNHILRRLPWHLWGLIQDDFSKKAEIALSTNPFRSDIKPLTTPVKVLAIFGGDEGDLNLDKDREVIERLKDYGAEVHIVPQLLGKPASEGTKKPKLSPDDLHQALTQDTYDILFYAGHSASDQKYRDGYLYLGNDEYYRITDLRPSLREAIDRGLKLAIFNSCDGLGLADFLASVKMPFTVVFRESVPDPVAIAFLSTFFENFSTGIPLYPALRKARTKLIQMEHDFPAASWLPIISQSRSQPELSWVISEVENIEEVEEDQTNKVDNDSPNSNEESEKGDNPLPKRLLWLGGSVAVIGIVAWGVYRYFQPPTATEYGSSLSLTEASIGEDLLISSEIWPRDSDAYNGCINDFAIKEQGIDNFNQKKWDAAIDSFMDFREVCKIDPETLIYLNNAEVEKTLPSQSDLIRIAVVVPIGDRNTVGTAQEILRGAAQAQTQTNADGGIGGRLVQIQIVNDSSRNSSDANDLTDKVAEALSQDSAIVAVIGSYTSPATREAAEYYIKNGLVSISPTSTAVRDENDFPLDSSVFRTAPTDAKAAEDLAEQIEALGYEKVGIVYESDSDYSRSLREQIGKLLGDTVELTVPDSCDLSDENAQFSPNKCINTDLADTEAIVILPSTEVKDQSERIISQNADLTPPKPLLGGDAIYGDKALTEVGKKIEGMLVSVPWHEGTGINNRADSFLEDAQEIWNTTSVNWRTALAYDATQALIGAINQISGEPTREAIETSLLNGRFDGFLGDDTIEFDDSGDRILDQSLGLGTIVQVQCAGMSNDSCSYGKPN